MRNNYYSLCVAGILLVGCSSGDDAGVASDRDENVYFTGGVSCSVSSTSSTDSTSTTGTVENSTAVDCSADQNTSLPGPGVASTGSGSLLLADQELPITGAIISIAYRDNNNDFMNVDFTLHDGNVRTRLQQSSNGNDSTSRLDWGIYGASFVLSTELQQQGSPMFTGGSFEVVLSEDGVSPAAQNHALEPLLFIDKRSDGMITGVDEIAKVVSGNINITGNAPDWSVIVDVTLEDGTQLGGNYAGSLYELPDL